MRNGPAVHFWWHFHQPSYITGERALMPWVKLHACRDYLDMGWVVERIEQARITVNWTPVLLVQLDAWLDDPFFDLFARPVDSLLVEEKVFLLEHCFDVNWRTTVYPNPRYVELLMLRGTNPSREEMLHQAQLWARRDWDDLQFCFLSSWCGMAMREDPQVREILERERESTLDERLALMERMKTHAQRILPLYRKLREEGRLALTTTPFYHPILPLLVNPDEVARDHPDLPIPPISPHPKSARLHVEKALTCHEEHFGSPPDGMWPAEGSVSNSILPLLEGIPLIGTDEAILRASECDAHDPSLLYTHPDFGGIMAFRDHRLSDKIGFVYGGMDPNDAVEDFCNDVAANYSGGVVNIILDGENPWGGYRNLGRPFLEGLYSRCAERFSLVNAIDLPSRGEPVTIRHLASGSWIDGNFKIWIGDPVKNRAWLLLEETHQVVSQACEDPSCGALMAAEGSDWFWWYGEGNSSPYEPEFDQLFRSHLEQAYEDSGLTPPGRLKESLVERGISSVTTPFQTICPTINGRVDSYIEWEGAGRYTDAGDSMMGTWSPFKCLYYGFDGETLYVRVDPARPSRADELFKDLDTGLSFHLPRVCFVQKETMRIGMEKILEIAVPLSAFGGEAGKVVSFHIVWKQGDRVLYRYPRTGLIVCTVPGPHFNEEMWCV